MIDIIIPAYNAHNTIEKTLCSIGLQANKKILNVYIINDGSKNDYKEICNKYSKILNIKELKLKANKGPGFARQYGLNHSKGKYIIFLDSDDILYDCYTTSNLYYEMEYNKLDICISSVYYETENNIYKYYPSHMHNLHGKIFRRSCIENNNIKFFNSRCNEDTMFFYMAKLCTDNIKVIKIPTYIHQYNKQSISESNNFWANNIKVFAKNACKLIDFIDKKYINRKKSSVMLANILICLYYEYNENYLEIDKKSIINCIKPFYKKADKLIRLLTNEEWNEIYHNYYSEIIPRISFYDFLNLIKK